MNTNKMQISNGKIDYLKIHTDGTFQQDTISAPVETNANLMVNGEDWLTFMCSPFQLEELGIGFLFNENVIQSIDEIAQYQFCQNNIIDIWLHHKAEKPAKWTRTSGCTGGKSARFRFEKFQPVKTFAPITPQTVIDNVRQLLEAQVIYRQSRGVHCSALSDSKSIRYVSEDIGRHNTFDKLAGQYLLNKDSIENLTLLTTGRLSSEMMQKAARLKAPFVISLTSPTNMSITIAKELGITLIGYARKETFNLYTHPERVTIKGITGNSINLPEDFQQT